jgi:TatD DNase family protein
MRRRSAQIHVHCFTDTPDFAQRLLDHFANLYIGITGALPSVSVCSSHLTIRQA